MKFMEIDIFLAVVEFIEYTIDTNIRWNYKFGFIIDNIIDNMIMTSDDINLNRNNTLWHFFPS